MPKHVIVDGFNVIRRDSELSRIEKLDFYRAQEALVDKLAAYRKGTHHQVSIILDAKAGSNPYRQHQQKKGVTVIYSSQGETADEVIEEMVVSTRGNQSGCIVVTADRVLANFCLQHRVNVVGPDELMRRSKPMVMPWHDPDFAHGKFEEQGWLGHTQKKGNSRRAPKRKRKSKGLW